MKNALTSKTIWGVVIMILPTILQVFGVSVLPADVQSVVDPAQQLLGASLAAYGRIKAQGPLKLRF